MLAEALQRGTDAIFRTEVFGINMNSGSYSLSVLIVAFRVGALLHRTLNSISDANLSAVKQVVLVLNGPGEVEGLVEGYPKIPLFVLRVCDRRKTVALNAGVRHIGHGPVVFLDDDVRVASDLFEVYAESFSKRDSGAFFGGATKCDYLDPPKPWLLPFLPDSARGLMGTKTDFEQGIRSFLGFNWAARAETILGYGGYDELIGPGTRYSAGDETKMQSVLLSAGLSAVFLENALVWHFVPPDRCSLRWALGRHMTASALGTRSVLASRHFASLDVWRKLKYSALLPFNLNRECADRHVRGKVVAFAFSMARCFGILRGILSR